MTAQRTVAKNVFVMMGTQVVTWSLTLIFTIFVPRYLGVEAVGKFHFSSSLWAMVVVVVSFGMDLLLTKEIACNPKRTSELVGNSILVRIGLFLIGWLFVLGFLWALHYDALTCQVVYVMGVSYLIWEIIRPIQAALQGVERMEYISLSTVVGKAFNTAVCLLLLALHQGVLMITAAGIPAALLVLAIQSRSLQRLVRLQIQPRLETMRYLLRKSFTYLVGTVFLVIYMQFDIVILSIALRDDKVVGWYGVADQFCGTLLVIPTVMITVIFPVLSRAYSMDLEEQKRITRHSFDLLTVLSIPIGLGVLVLADPVIALLYGPDFAASGPVLALMGIVLIPTSLNILLGYSLVSIDRLSKWTVVMAIATFLTLPLDLLLIPLCQQWFANTALVGAMSYLVTETGMLITGFYLIPRGTLNRQNVALAGRALFVGGLMVAGIWWLREQFLLIPVMVGVLIYTVGGWLFQLIPLEDLALIWTMGQGVLRKFRPQPIPMSEDSHGN